MIDIKLTAKQYSLVSELIERVSANERNFDKDSEQILKEVAEKFNSEYINIEESKDDKSWMYTQRNENVLGADYFERQGVRI